MELDILQFIQKIGSDFFDFFFGVFSTLGGTAVVAAFVPIIYWCFDKATGEEIALDVFSGCYVNSLLKGIIARARPVATHENELRRGKYDYIYDSQLHDGEYLAESFPSGHSQASASLISGIAYRKGLKKYWPLLLIPVLVGVSRLYFGMHWPTDVLAGLAVGFCVSAVVHICVKINKKKTFIAIPIVASALMFLDFFGVERKQLLITAALLALLWGGCLGMLTENKYIEFSTGDIKWWMRVLRLPVGLVAVGLCAGVVFLPLWLLGADKYVMLIPVALVGGFAMATAAPLAFKMFRLI